MDEQEIQRRGRAAIEFHARRMGPGWNRRRVSVDKLNDVMEFDHVILVYPDGTVAEPPNVYAPELNAICDADGSHTRDTDPELCRQAEASGWSLQAGWTGQDRYNGPCMHQSEVIGGGLAAHILATPGYWVVAVVNEDDNSDPTSWALAYRESLTAQ